MAKAKKKVIEWEPREIIVLRLSKREAIVLAVLLGEVNWTSPHVGEVIRNVWRALRDIIPVAANTPAHLGERGGGLPRLEVSEENLKVAGW